MAKDSALAQLRRLFTYRADAWFDLWQVMRPSAAGRLVGDCEDFSLTLAYLLAGRSWPRFWWHQITGKSVIWFCRMDDGQGHATLWHRGSGWVDNVVPFWRPASPHRLRFPFLFPLLAIKLAAGWFVVRIDRTL